MKQIVVLIGLLVMPLQAILSAETSSPELPFAPDAISRLSLDNKPRSLAIRQGSDFWLGYDLERATVMKVWKAPEGKSGLTKSGFVTRSVGTSFFEDVSESAWELQQGDRQYPLTIRYLGCSQRSDHFELRWELTHELSTLVLYERVLRIGAVGKPVAVRELRADKLAANESLLPPQPVRKAWQHMVDGQRKTPQISGSEWHRFSLFEPGATP